jgi:hypothetical protein
MALQNFVNRVGPAVSALWLNNLDYSRDLLNTTGAANAYVADFPGRTVAVTLTDGIVLRFLPIDTNTGASTLNFASTGALPIVDCNGNAVVANEIQIGEIVWVQYVAASAAWRLVDKTKYDSVLSTSNNGRVFVDYTSSTIRLGGTLQAWTRVASEYQVNVTGADANGTLLQLETSAASAAFGNLRVVNTRAGASFNKLFHLTNTVDSNFEVDLSESGAASKFCRIGNTVAAPMDLKTNNATRMRIESSGRVLVGATTNFGGTATMDIEGGSGTALFPRNNTAGSIVIACWNMGTSGNNGFIDFATEGSYTSRGSITYNRGANLTAYNTTSDRRLKRTISRGARTLDPEIDRIEVHHFEWIESGYKGIGCYAQELQEVAPEAVTPGDEGDVVGKAWGVDYSKLVPRLILEIQSLRRRVAQLEARGNGLPGRKE